MGLVNRTQVEVGTPARHRVAIRDRLVGHGHSDGARRDGQHPIDEGDEVVGVARLVDRALRDGAATDVLTERAREGA